jgi:hypothetical protein
MRPADPAQLRETFFLREAYQIGFTYGGWHMLVRMPTDADDLEYPGRITELELDILRQRETIAKLELMGHEVTDAKKHLGEMLISLAGLQRAIATNEH